MADERRRAPRLGLRLNVSYTIVGTKKLGASLAKDISGTGVRFVAEHPLECGTPLELVVALPDRTEPIRCLGEVVWSFPRPPTDVALRGGNSEVGVRFLNIDPRDRALIEQYAWLYPSEPLSDERS